MATLASLFTFAMLSVSFRLISISLSLSLCYATSLLFLFAFSVLSVCLSSFLLSLCSDTSLLFYFALPSLSLSLPHFLITHFPTYLKPRPPHFVFTQISPSLSLSPAGTCGHTDMSSSLTTRCHHRPGPWMAPPPICTLGCPLENGTARSSLSAHFRSRLRAWTSPCIVQRDAILGVNWRWSFFIVLFHVLFGLSFFYSFPPFFVAVSFVFFLASFLSFFLLL